MLIHEGQKLVMIGDSITDAGRVQPIAEGLFDPLGRGYVTMVEAMLGAFYPQLGIRVVNTGNSGDTTRELASRWQRDVVDLKPNWVSLMIGTNDVWQQFNRYRQTEMHVLPAEFEKNLESLVAAARPSLTGMVLMSPFLIESQRQDLMRLRVEEYGRIVKAIAQRHQAIFVDTQAAFDAVLAHCYSAHLALDRVHPNQIGHMVLARAFLKAIGFEWK